jgi:indolepyruvate ferredoxin oxidoreductase beta subunit
MGKIFNIVIAGAGGQGLITLTNIISNAALIEGYDVKTSELHGLSQRGGSVQTYIRFGKKVYSPLVPLAGADLILGLETAEALRNISYADKNTVLITNEYFFPYLGGPSKEEIIKKIKSFYPGIKHIVPASEICKKELKNEVISGVYLLGWAVLKKALPLKEESILKAISKTIPPKYLDLNKKAFNLAKND